MTENAQYNPLLTMATRQHCVNFCCNFRWCFQWRSYL